ARLSASPGVSTTQIVSQIQRALPPFARGGPPLSAAVPGGSLSTNACPEATSDVQRELVSAGGQGGSVSTNACSQATADVQRELGPGEGRGEGRAKQSQPTEHGTPAHARCRTNPESEVAIPK